MVYNFARISLANNTKPTDPWLPCTVYYVKPNQPKLKPQTGLIHCSTFIFIFILAGMPGKGKPELKTAV